MLRIMFNCLGIKVETPVCAFLTTCYSCFSMDLGSLLPRHLQCNILPISNEHKNKLNITKLKNIIRGRNSWQNTFGIIVAMYRCYITPAFEVPLGYTVYVRFKGVWDAAGILGLYAHGSWMIYILIIRLAYFDDTF